LPGIGAPQFLKRSRKVREEAMLGSKIENAKRTLYGDASPGRFQPRRFIINQQNIRRQLFGQGNRFALTLPKNG
jgi:hypothetical protein